MKKLLLPLLLLLSFSKADAQILSGYYEEGFESTTFPPTNGTDWIVTNVTGPTYTWASSTAQAHSGTRSAFIRYDISGGLDYLIAPHFTVAGTDSVVFWMRLAFQGYSPDRLRIMVSNTGTATTDFTTTLLTLEELVNYPPNSTTWYRYAVSLSAFAGQNVYVAFVHNNTDGDGLYIDDVAIGTKPANSITAVSLDNATTNAVGASITPMSTFTNTGTAIQTFNVMMTGSNGYSSTQTITGLAPGATQQVSFTPTTITTAGPVTFRSYSMLTGEANLLDDTVSKVLNFYAPFVHEGWSSQAVMPGGRWAFGPSSYQVGVKPNDTGMVVAVSGGDATFANTASVERLNSGTGLWQTLAPVPASRTQANSFHWGNKIYFIGGYGGSFSPVNTVNIYDIPTNTWTLGATMPTAVGDYAAAQKDSLIYIISGYNGSTDVNLVQIYNTTTNTWTAGTPFAGIAVGGGRAGIAKNTIVVTGGYSQTLAGTQSQAWKGVIDPINPALITWTALPAYPGGTTGRHGGGGAMSNLGTMVYFTAGDPNGQGTAAINTTWGYDVVTDEWKIGPNKPTGVSNINSITPMVVNDTLFYVSVGGYNGTAVVNVNEWLKIGRAGADTITIAGTDTICYNTSAMLVATDVSGAIKWQESTDSLTFNFIAGATNDTFYTPNLTTTMYYRAVGYGHVDSVIAPGFAIHLWDTVAIGTQPMASTVCAGQPAGFSVNATGQGLTYQWRKDGADLADDAIFSGVNTNTLSISDATGQAGTYEVIITGTCSTDTSDAATLTVNPLPTATVTSTAGSICYGGNTDVTISFTGTAPYNFTYNNGMIDSTENGYGSNTYTFNVMPAAATTYYVVNITDANNCSATVAGLSDSATVTMDDSAVIAGQPVDATSCVGTSASFTVNATGTGLTYQWYNGTTQLADNAIYGGTGTSTLTISDVTGLNGMEYYAVVNAVCGVAKYSDTVMLTEDFNNSWTGVVSQDWNNTGNWSCGILPTLTTNVMIPSTAPNMPWINVTNAQANNITIDAGASLMFIGTVNELQVAGNITDNGTFDASSGTVVLLGTGAQNIPGVIYGNLDIMGGSVKTLDGDATITGMLTLSSGHIVLDSNDLILSSPWNQAGGSASSFIVTNDSGNVVGQSMGVGGNPDAVTFHVGTAVGSYNPITLENLGTVDTFMVRIVDSVFVDGYGVSPVTVDNPVVNKTWMVSETTPGGSIVNMTPYWNHPGDEINGFDTSHVYVAHYMGGMWTSDLDSALEAPGAIIAGNMLAAFEDSITSLSPFTVASSGPFPLNIKLIDVSAANAGSRNKVDWKSATEATGDSYVVETSADGKSFTQLATVVANGKPSAYTYWHQTPVTGVNYYRIKTIDADNKIGYSKVVSATVKATGIFTVEAFPNPVTSNVTVMVKGTVTGTGYVTVNDVTGKVIKSAVKVENNKAEINLGDVANGMYFINYSDDANQQSIKINKQ